MESDEPINPYAAPKARLIDSNTEASRRPASVKWAAFLFGFFTLVMTAFYWQAISSRGLQKLWQEESVALSLLLPVGLGFSLFGGRRKIAYYVNSGILAIILIRSSWRTFFWLWAAPDAFAKIWLPSRCFEAVMICLLGLLFYRFTFGLPSRRYFGVAREEAKTP